MEKLKRFKGLTNWRSTLKVHEISGNVIQAIESFQSIGNSFFIHKSKLDKLQKILTYISNYLTLHCGDDFPSSHTKYFKDLERRIKDLKPLVMICANSQYSGKMNHFTLEKSFTLLYSVYYYAILLIYKLNMQYNIDLIDFIRAHINDVQKIQEIIKEKENNKLFNEISEFLSLKNKSISLDGYKTISVTSAENDSIYILVESPQGHNEIFRFFHPNVDCSKFLHYVAVFSHIEHPQIIKFINSIKYQPYCTITDPFEHCMLKSKHNLDPTEKTIIILEIARSIEYLHARRLIYCDIDSSSICITKENLPKLINFKYVQQLSNNISVKLPFGRYSAPETGIEPISYNEKIDVYSFSILVWELLNNETPFAELSDDQIAEQVIKQDQRPIVSQSSGLTEFLIRGWSRNPDLRPSFKEIVQQIEEGKIIFPGTDINKLEDHVKSTRSSHEAALKGLFSLTPKALYEMVSKEIDEFTIELVVNAYLDKTNKDLFEAAKDIIEKYIKPKQSFVVSELVTLVRIINDYPFFEDVIIKEINKKSYQSEFINALCERLPVDMSVPFYIKHFLVCDDDAKFILEFCAKKPERLQELVAESVAQRFSNSNILYQYAQRAGEYCKRSFFMMNSASKEHLIENFTFIQLFADISGVAFAPVLNRIFLKLGSELLIKYDNMCVLANKLVRAGYTGTIVDLIDCSEYALLVTNYVINTIQEKPIEQLRLIVAVDKFDEIRDSLYKMDVFKVLEQNLQLKQFEFVGASLLSLHFPVSVLTDHIKFADQIRDLLLEVDDPFDASGLLTCLVPFSVNLKYTFTQIVPEVISKFLMMNDTIIASRALSLAVSYVENPNVAKIMASNEVVESLTRFFGHSTDSFEYLSLRVIARLSPHLDDQCDLQALVKQMFNVLNSARKAELFLLAITNMPQQIILENQDMVKAIKVRFPGNLNIRKYIEAIEPIF